MTRIADMTSPEITDAAGPTDEDFRAIGFTKEASNWPRDELAVKMIAAFNGVPADDLPSLAWRYFPNKQTADAWKRVADVALAAGRAEAVAAPAAPSEAQDDEDRCIACDKPFKPGDMVLNDVSGGSIHIECCGPDRESYVGPGDPFPKGYAWQPAPEAEPAAWATGDAKAGGWTLDPKFIDKVSRAAREATGYDATWEVVEHVYLAALAAPSASQEALREAASIISDLFASVRMGDPSRTFDYEWERRGLSWLAAQWARDPGTLINMWTADKVRSHHAALAQSAPVKAGG